LVIATAEAWAAAKRAQHRFASERALAFK